MLRILTLAVVLTPALALAAADNNLDPQPPRIEHAPGFCLAAGTYPQIEARISPAGAVEAARVFFHTADAPQWYSVAMERDGDAWRAALPRPKPEATRFAYFVEARGRESQARLPESSAHIVDLSASCWGSRLPTAGRGPRTLGVLAGAPREPAGFDVRDVEAFVESTSFDTSAPSKASPTETMLMVPFKKVRLKTVPPPARSEAWLREDDRTVTLKVEAGDEPITRTKRNKFLYGEVEAIDGDRLVLSVPGRGRVVVRQGDLQKLESERPGSAGGAVLGVLGGCAGGFLATVLACVTIDGLCESTVPLWLGTTLGMGLGGAAGGSESWKPASLVPQRAVGLSLRPRRGGAAVALNVQF